MTGFSFKLKNMSCSVNMSAITKNVKMYILTSPRSIQGSTKSHWTWWLSQGLPHTTIPHIVYLCPQVL